MKTIKFLCDCVLLALFIILGSYIGSAISLYVHKDKFIDNCVEGK